MSASAPSAPVRVSTSMTFSTCSRRRGSICATARSTVGRTDTPGTSLVLYPPDADPGITENESATIAEMMAKGTFASIILATKDLDATFEQLQAGDTEVVQEPTDQPYGIRDCALRDPAGNMVRIQQLR